MRYSPASSLCDSTKAAQFGLIAEEVAEVDPDLVVRDKSGEIYSVRYDAVNAMLLNEFLKEHHKNEQQESRIAEQEAKIARQEKQIEALTAGLQKVTAQLELSNLTADGFEQISRSNRVSWRPTQSPQ